MTKTSSASRLRKFSHRLKFDYVKFIININKEKGCIIKKEEKKWKLKY